LIINRPRSASEGNEWWEINRFNQWCQCEGLDTSIPFEKILLQECGMLLARFFSMLYKPFGTRYPSGSIDNMLDSFNRLLKNKVNVLEKLVA